MTGGAGRGDGKGRGPLATYFPLLAVAWLVVATILFHTSPLDNNGDWTRLDVWLELPSVLIANFDTVSVEEAAANGGVPTGWRYLSQRVPQLSIALFTLSAASLIGFGTVTLLYGDHFQSVDDAEEADRRDGTLFERVLVGIAVGTSLASLIVLANGTAGKSVTDWLAPLAIICAIISWRTIDRRAWRWWHRENARGLPLLTGVKGLAVGIPFIAAAFFAAALPSSDFDVREYHLGGPAEYFKNGAVTFLPHNVYTSFPFLTEMLSLRSLAAAGDIEFGVGAAKTTLAGFGLFTAAAVGAIATRLASPSVGVIAAIIYLSAPWTHRLSAIAYVEGGLNFFTAVTTLLVIVLASDFLAIDEARRRRLIFLAGLTAGSAAACKYPGLVQVTIPAAVAIAVIVWRGEPRGVSPGMRTVDGKTPSDAIGPGTADESDKRPVTVYRRIRGLTPPARLLKIILALFPFALAVAITFGPWLLKNWVETSNPVYPLLWDVFSGRDWDAVLDAKWKAAHSPPHHDPVAFFTDLRGVFVGSDWQTGLLLASVPLSLFALKRDPRRIGLIIFAIYLYAVWWVLTHRIDRFWLPLMPILSVLAAIGLTQPRIPKAVAYGVLGLNILWNFAFITTPLCGNNAFLADLPSLRKAILKFAPAIEAVNDLPDDAAPLLVGEAATLEADKPVLYNTVFDRSLFVAAVFGTEGSTAGDAVPRPADEIRTHLRDLGATHVVVDWAEVLRYGTTYGFWPEVTPGLFDDLVADGVLTNARVTAVLYAGNLDDAKRRLAESWHGPLSDDAVIPRVVVYRLAD